MSSFIWHFILFVGEDELYCLLQIKVINICYKKVVSSFIWHFTLFMSEDELCYLLQITDNKYLL